MSLTGGGAAQAAPQVMSLRSVVTDRAGNTTTQTVLNAYPLR